MLYTTYERIVESSSIAEFIKQELRITGVAYSSIQTPKILRVTGNAQTVCTRPFLLHNGPGDEARGVPYPIIVLMYPYMDTPHPFN